MAKLKTPLLSLGAHGTIADTLTFQKRGRGTMARKKPVPIDAKTLPQIYHRWLYQDYVAYWHDQTAETQQLWETNARPHHMTGFAYWMKYYLTNLPDIAGMWHLDERTGITAIDFSKNKNTGTLYGPTHVPGPIDYALKFDGLDDYVICPDANLPFGVSPRTLSFWFKRGYADPTIDYEFIVSYGSSGEAHTFGAAFYIATTDLSFFGWGVSDFDTGFDIPDTNWHFIVITFDGITVRTYMDGIAGNTDTPALNTLSSGQLIVADRVDLAGYNSPGCVDEVRVYNRVLTSQDQKRHAERRYPA